MNGLTLERSYWQRGIEYLAGVDEAGRGPLAGPVVAAAVIFPKEQFIDGVDDSKKLREKKRDRLFQLIREQSLSIGIGIVPHDVIDRVNIYQASILAMRKALEDLTIPPQFVVADGNSFRHDGCPFENIVDGDAKVFTIAAASIVAKVTRDRMMREYHEVYPLYGFARHKGYGTKQHREAIREHGLCEIHRKTFRVKLA
ncbi:MAG: ribonuclease HII [Bacteroidota bacterium]